MPVFLTQCSIIELFSMRSKLIYSLSWLAFYILSSWAFTISVYLLLLPMAECFMMNTNEHTVGGRGQNMPFFPLDPHFSQTISETGHLELCLVVCSVVVVLFLLNLSMDGHPQDKLKYKKIPSLQIPTWVCVHRVYPWCIENNSHKAFCCLAWDNFGCLKNFT